MLAARIDASNLDQAHAWDGDEGGYWAANSERFDAAVAAYHRPFMDAAHIRATDRVLDIGCGTGQTTRDAGRRAAAGAVLGVDLSSQMIHVARQLAATESLSNVRFEVADAQVYPFEPQTFDVAMSRTGAMFFGDPVAAFTNFAGALRDGGRLTLLVWQPLLRNEWIVEITTAFAAGRERPAPPTDAPGPFSLADPQRIRTILFSAGFGEPQVEPLTGPFYLGTDAQDALEYVLGLAGWMLEGLDDTDRVRALNNLRATLARHASASGVLYDSAAWLISARKS